MRVCVRGRARTGMHVHGSGGVHMVPAHVPQCPCALASERALHPALRTHPPVGGAAAAAPQQPLGWSGRAPPPGGAHARAGGAAGAGC